MSGELELLLRGRRFNEQRLLSAVAPHVEAPSDAAPPAEELAREVVEAIKDEAWMTHEGPEAQVFEIRRLHQEQIERISSVVEPPHVVIATFDWSPAELHEHLKELAKSDPPGYANLQEELAAGNAEPQHVLALMKQPPPWLQRGSGKLWLMIGRLAAAHGLFNEAEEAFIAAESRALPDRVVAIALRAEVAAAAGRMDSARALAEKAYRLDPTNAAASILYARFEPVSHEKLRLLDDAVPTTATARAALAATRALALLQERRISEAAATAEAALGQAPDSWYVQEIAALTALYLEQERDASGEGADWTILRQTATRFLGLRDRMLERGRSQEALGFLGRAAQAHAAAHNTGGAIALLREAVGDSALPEVEDNARIELAAAAVALEEWGLAALLLPTSDAIGATVLRATVAINTGDPASALETLDAIIADDSLDMTARAEAALTRAHAAVRGIGDWSAAAERLIRETNDTTATVLKARFLERRGQREEAERLLAADGSPAAQDFLVAIAVDAEEYALALERMEAVVKQAPTPFRRVHLAGMLLGTDRTRALVMLAELRTDRDVPVRFRADAAEIATRDAYDAGRFEEATDRAREWLALDSSNQSAAWVLIHALQKKGDVTAALAADDEFQPVADTEWEVSIAARLYSENLDHASALERLVQLSARTDHPNPTIKAWIARLAQ